MRVERLFALAQCEIFSYELLVDQIIFDRYNSSTLRKLKKLFAFEKCSTKQILFGKGRLCFDKKWELSGMPLKTASRNLAVSWSRTRIIDSCTVLAEILLFIFIVADFCREFWINASFFYLHIWTLACILKIWIIYFKIYLTIGTNLSLSNLIFI